MLSPACARRKEQLEQGLKAVLRQLQDGYRPEKVILFGSLATGDIGEWSDLDLALIKPTDKPYFDRIEELVELCDYPVATDFLVYTPEEFEYESRNNPFVREEIHRKGKVVYDASQGPLAS